MDTMERIEEYLESLEEYIFASLSSATTDLPNVHEAVNRLWLDISRYGPPLPSFPEMHIPVLGDFQVPPPPPPPPPPPHVSLLSKSVNWTCRHPWMVSGLAVGVVGASLMVGYRNAHARRRVRQHPLKAQQTNTNERRQVVVVLGGDTPLALTLIRDLEARGYIVIASVSTSEAVQDLEQRCQGYVRALILDPHELSTIPTFLRALTSTLSRKFPISSSGDPYVSPSSHLYIQSVVCLLTLQTSLPSIYAPLEHIPLRNTYLPYLNATQIAPLQVLQGLMPLLRTGPARARDKGQKTIIVCLPAVETCVGLPFASIPAMSAAGTLRGIEVLRREVNLAAMTDSSESMKNIKIVTVDVGVLDVGSDIDYMPREDALQSMEDWSSSERVVYGPAFASTYQGPSPSSGTVSSIFRIDSQGVVARKPTDVRVFVDKVVSVITGGRHRAPLHVVGHIMGRIGNWIRGNRFSIGAGAKTYRVASQLPSVILDVLLNVPYYLISVRNRLVPAQPFIVPGQDTVHLPSVEPKDAASASEEGAEPESGNESSQDISETNSEVDGGSIGDSTWIHLRRSQGSVNS